MDVDPEALLNELLRKLRNDFSAVQGPRIEPLTQNRLIDVMDGSNRWLLSVTERFLDGDGTFEESARRVMEWDVVGAIKRAPAGGTVWLTETGIRTER